MISIHGIYENGNIVFIEPVPEHTGNKRRKVIVTFMEELEEPRNGRKFVGSLTGVGRTMGNLTEPFGDEWELD